MKVDDLRLARKNPSVLFMEFTKSYKKDKSALYCFFEGDEDSKYYAIRIRNIIRRENYSFFPCNGKNNVLAINRLISIHEEYKNAKLAYFIDKDFDSSIYEATLNLNGIYETPCHSIENFYTSQQCFSEILRHEFKLSDSDDYFEKFLLHYLQLQEKFHDAVETLNAWLACQMDVSGKVPFSNLTISGSYIDIYLDRIRTKYSLNDLYKKFPEAQIISQEKLEAKKNELRAKGRQKSFRGKFEIEFLFVFLQRLIQGEHPICAMSKNT